MQSTTTIVPTSENVPTIVLKPIQSIDTIIEAYKEYNLLKDRLLTENDYQVIKGKKCIKKSGFRKLGTAFGISTEITRENRITLDKYFVYEVTVRATSPNGRYVEACGSCASNEREFSHIENDVRNTGQTRATNRAISDLIGSGEVSAEEVNQVQTTTIDTSDNQDDEPITIKQRNYLIKLIETRYQDEPTRATLFNRLVSLTKSEARDAIGKMLA